MLDKYVMVNINDYQGDYYLSDYFCPECGNQTLYYLGNQMASYTCIRCGTHWQIRLNTKPSNLDDALLSKVTINRNET